VVSWTPLAGGVGGAPSLDEGDRELGARSAERRRRPLRSPGGDETKGGDGRHWSASHGVGDGGGCRVFVGTVVAGSLFLFSPMLRSRARQNCHETFGAQGRIKSKGSHGVIGL
jgi:hypothetical protein